MSNQAAIADAIERGTGRDETRLAVNAIKAEIEAVKAAKALEAMSAKHDAALQEAQLYSGFGDQPSNPAAAHIDREKKEAKAELKEQYGQYMSLVGKGEMPSHVNKIAMILEKGERAPHEHQAPDVKGMQR